MSLLVRFFPCVTPHVNFDTSLLGEPLVALFTLEWLRTWMCSLMTLHVTLCCETFTTHLATKWLLPRMFSHVHCKKKIVGKGFWVDLKFGNNWTPITSCWTYSTQRGHAEVLTMRGNLQSTCFIYLSIFLLLYTEWPSTLYVSSWVNSSANSPHV